MEKTPVKNRVQDPYISKLLSITRQFVVQSVSSFCLACSPFNPPPPPPTTSRLFASPRVLAVFRRGSLSFPSVGAIIIVCLSVSFSLLYCNHHFGAHPSQCSSSLSSDLGNPSCVRRSVGCTASRNWRAFRKPTPPIRSQSLPSCGFLCGESVTTGLESGKSRNWDCGLLLTNSDQCGRWNRGEGQPLCETPVGSWLSSVEFRKSRARARVKVLLVIQIACSCSEAVVLYYGFRPNSVASWSTIITGGSTGSGIKINITKFWIFIHAIPLPRSITI